MVSLAVAMIGLLLFIFFLAIFYIPFPADIADRRKLQFFEFLLRIGNEYMGELVEALFGYRIRNYYTRFLLSIPYRLWMPIPKHVRVKNDQFVGVPVIIYEPRGSTSSNALIVFVHGGGWATMRAAFYNSSMYSLVERLNMVIVSIDYRLAPEVLFPSALDECEAVVRYLHDIKCREMGLDPNRIAIMGDSAGGNICAVLAQRFHRMGERIAKLQVLIYPVIHCLDMRSPSYIQHYRLCAGTAVLNPRQMARWFMLYLGIPATPNNVDKMLANRHLTREKKASDLFKATCDQMNLPETFTFGYERTREGDTEEGDPELSSAFSKFVSNPDFCPIVGDNLRGLIPAMVISAGYDILRDEAILYVKRLRSFDVAVQWNHYKQAYHAVLTMPCSQQRRQILDDIAIYLREHL